MKKKDTKIVLYIFDLTLNYSMVEHFSDLTIQWLKYDRLIRSKNQPPPFLAYKLAIESTMKEYCNKNEENM